MKGRSEYDAEKLMVITPRGRKTRKMKLYPTTLEKIPSSRLRRLTNLLDQGRDTLRLESMPQIQDSYRHLKSPNFGAIPNLFLTKFNKLRSTHGRPIKFDAGEMLYCHK